MIFIVKINKLLLLSHELPIEMIDVIQGHSVIITSENRIVKSIISVNVKISIISIVNIIILFE